MSQEESFKAPLHSTMYLLNPEIASEYTNTRSPLHSTMYLLNRAVYYFEKKTYAFFTFHNVSIKSFRSLSYVIIVANFTFHNVSIKSIILPAVSSEPLRFTFHNVSIKSISYCDFKRCNYLYIPQCIY